VIFRHLSPLQQLFLWSSTTSPDEEVLRRPLRTPTSPPFFTLHHPAADLPSKIAVFLLLRRFLPSGNFLAHHFPAIKRTNRAPCFITDNFSSGPLRLFLPRNGYKPFTAGEVLAPSPDSPLYLLRWKLAKLSQTRIPLEASHIQKEYFSVSPISRITTPPLLISPFGLWTYSSKPKE